ncbi:MAG: sigma-70 family RNA polymerase sigma factor [Myxococcales bacterium]|nr:sigma-70 family RNA polymerase sigma factor [Myxococcales bacterium]
MKQNKPKMTWNDGEARLALQRYEGIVRMMARRLRPVASLGQALDEDDLCAEGRVAVLEALGTYKGFGIEEHTWVRTRVRQRMIDAIRRMDLRSRDEMRLAVRYAAGDTEGKEQERGRVIAARRLVSMDASPADAEPMVNRMRDGRTRLSDDLAHEIGRHRRLREALQALPERQRQAIEMGLYQGMALREIGDVMGISESRVCQLQKRAVQHLRRAVSEQSVEEAA